MEDKAIDAETLDKYKDMTTEQIYQALLRESGK